MSEKKAKKLFNSMTNISDDIIEEAQISKAHKKSHDWVKWGAVAACICIIVAGTVVYLSKTFTGINNPAESGSSQEQLLAAIQQSDTFIETAEIETYVPVEGRLACYTQIYIGKAAVIVSPESPDSTERLAPFVGEEYAQHEDQIWYRVSNMDELKYLISKDETGILRLWKFKGFFVLDSYLKVMQDCGATQEEMEEYQHGLQIKYPDTDFSSYTYGEVYSIIYHVENAAEIAGIISSPSKANNTAAGKAIQEKVGTHTYENQDIISVFYDCTADVICRGTSVDNWESIYSDLDKYTYSFSTDAEDKLTSGEETWATRYLTITLQSGTTIDSWKYQALNGQFYEFGGISTEPLDENKVYALNEIFGIE